MTTVKTHYDRQACFDLVLQPLGLEDVHVVLAQLAAYPAQPGLHRSRRPAVQSHFTQKMCEKLQRSAPAWRRNNGHGSADNRRLSPISASSTRKRGARLVVGGGAVHKHREFRGGSRPIRFRGRHKHRNAAISDTDARLYRLTAAENVRASFRRSPTDGAVTKQNLNVN